MDFFFLSFKSWIVLPFWVNSQVKLRLSFIIFFSGRAEVVDRVLCLSPSLASIVTSFPHCLRYNPRFDVRVCSMNAYDDANAPSPLFILFLIPPHRILLLFIFLAFAIGWIFNLSKPHIIAPTFVYMPKMIRREWYESEWNLATFLKRNLQHIYWKSQEHFGLCKVNT